MIPHLGMASRVLIVGFGHFGQHIDQLLRDKAPGLRIDVFDLNKDMVPEDRYVSLEDADKYDLIVLAVPIAAYEDVLQQVVARMRQDAVLVDVASVKAHTCKLLKKYAAGRFYVSTHPMWGPQSYTKRGGDITGFRLVVADCTLPPARQKSFRSMLESLGLKVVKMEPEHHDSHLARTLFLTHFIGQTISFAGFDRTEIDTVSFEYLMSAVESVREDTSLFLDVYRFNKQACAAVLGRVEDSMHHVRQMIEGYNV